MTFAGSPTHCPNGGTLFRDQCYWYGGVNAWSVANEDCARFGDGVKIAVVQDPELNVRTWSPKVAQTKSIALTNLFFSNISRISTTDSELHKAVICRKYCI